MRRRSACFARSPKLFERGRGPGHAPIRFPREVDDHGLWQNLPVAVGVDQDNGPPRCRRKRSCNDSRLAGRKPYGRPVRVQRYAITKRDDDIPVEKLWAAQHPA